MTKHIIVDGSNIATEGRSVPSLAQLNEAVLALMKEYPHAKVSVVVDATFGHRIARKEVAEFNKAVDNNEVVCPPAGAVGKGDAFVLAIAEKVNGSVLSNDSYQEFHGKYKWLFDDGRLIGGKPVPHVGWVFVERTPVRGATSRRAVKSDKVVPKTPGPSPEASKPMPIPKAPPPTARERAANDVLPYLQFVENHPVGTKVKAVVSSYAANGMAVKIGEVNGYVPLKSISSPPPRSAREVHKLGDVLQLVVTGYTASRRSVDLGVPGVAVVPEAPAKAVSSKAVASKATRTSKAAPAKASSVKAPSAARPTAAKTSTTARPTAAKTSSAARPTAAKKVAPATRKMSGTKMSGTKKAAQAKPVARPAVKKAATAKKPVARKAVDARKASSSKAPAKKRVAQKK